MTILAAALALASPSLAEEDKPAATAPGTAQPAVAAEAENPDRFTREGMVIEFSFKPAARAGDTVTAGDWADVTFRITEAATGAPVRSRYPAAWMDLAEVLEARGERPLSCRDRISTYLKGIVGVRPMIDLNSHYLLVMNRDPSISVIDPAVGITGITNLFAQVRLERPGADWVKTGDQKRLFVTMPKAGKVAVVDTEVFKVLADVEAGPEPTRIALQADQRYLWVGNNGPGEGRSGVTAIDTSTLKPAAFIPTGRGHHEIIVSGDDRRVFVSNREDGSVTVIDVPTLTKVKDLKTGPMPISMGWSQLARAVYVADGKSGKVSVVDPDTLAIRAELALKPGLGPLRFTPDGRWGLAVNPGANKVFVIDPSVNKLVHDITVGDRPYEIAFTRQYAYVRSLGTERVALINLAFLGGKEKPRIQYFAAGERPPGQARDIGIANTMVGAVKEAAAFVANPAQGTVYYYMEGMTAPAGGFRNYGHESRAVEIADRSLREPEPGVYTGRVRVPAAGVYDVAMILDAPPLIHCFSATVQPNPAVAETGAPMSVQYKIAHRNVLIGDSVPVRIALADPKSGKPLTGLKDVQVLYYSSDGRGRTVVPAREVGQGEYEAEVKVTRPTTYYVFVRAASKKVNYSDLPFATLIGMDEATAKAFAAREAAAREMAAKRQAGGGKDTAAGTPAVPEAVQKQ
jgi:YVTN family beta-propeller protein